MPADQAHRPGGSAGPSAARRRRLRGWQLQAAGLLLALLPAAAAAFDLQGHRGARGLAPENTIAGFRRAMAIGVDTLELDVGLTRDGVLVVGHNPALEPELVRGPDGRHLPARGPLIASLTYAELQRYDVGRLQPGSAYAAQFPEQEPVDGERMPRLAEVLALAREHGHARLAVSIETKLNPDRPGDTAPPEAFVRALLSELRASGLPPERLSVQSFDWRTLQLLQREAPAYATVYLTSPNSLKARPDGQPSPWLAGFDPAAHGGSTPRLVKAAGGRIWSSAHAALDAATVREAQALGLTVLAWTVNEPARIAELLDLGVDGLISDHPERVRAELQRRGRALPPATAAAR